MPISINQFPNDVLKYIFFIASKDAPETAIMISQVSKHWKKLNTDNIQYSQWHYLVDRFIQEIQEKNAICSNPPTDQLGSSNNIKNLYTFFKNINQHTEQFKQKVETELVPKIKKLAKESNNIYAQYYLLYCQGGSLNENIFDAIIINPLLTTIKMLNKTNDNKNEDYLSLIKKNTVTLITRNTKVSNGYSSGLTSLDMSSVNAS